MKLGVYIGSFNPVHLIHEKIVNDLIESKVVDKIVIIPTGDKYHLKNNLIAFKYRYDMLKTTFKNLKDVIISDFERDDYNFTYQNIKLLKKLYNDDLYLIIGADNLFQLKQWRNSNYLLENCYFVVFCRNELNVKEYINKNFTNYGNKFIIKEPLGNISSTLIRERLKNNLNVDEYISKSVKDYIFANNLYKGE